MPKLILKPGREKSLLRHHPWVFSGAVMEKRDSPKIGETVSVHSSEGVFLAWAAYSPHSQIVARVWSWEQEEVIDADFFRQRLDLSIRARKHIINVSQTNALRLVYGESDGLPGLIVDQYKDTVVIQLLSAGVDYWKDVLAHLIQEITGVGSIYERSDTDVRNLEGLPLRSGLLYGDELPDPLSINENGLRYWVDIRTGHKTGFYLDQRANRARLRELAKGMEVLDCFAYTGGFSVAALAGGADSVLAVEASAGALETARENVHLNSLPIDRFEFLEGDVFKVLRTFRDRGDDFDLVVLDPPKFAKTSSQEQKAARGYKDINLLAFKLLRPGGLLFTFSCSGGISEALFQKIVAGAALDARVHAQIIERLSQAEDHPVALNYPESAYLKGYIIRVDG